MTEVGVVAEVRSDRPITLQSALFGCFLLAGVGHVTPAESQRWLTLRFPSCFFLSAAFTFDLWGGFPGR